MLPNTSASRIKNVRCKCIGAYIVSINKNPVFTAESAITALQALATSDDKSFRIVFAPDRFIPVFERRADSPLHLSVDQVRVINQIPSIQTFSTRTYQSLTIVPFYLSVPSTRRHMGPRKNKLLAASHAASSRVSTIGRIGREPSLNNLTLWLNKKCMAPHSYHQRTSSFSDTNIGTTLSNPTARERHAIVVTDPLDPPPPSSNWPILTCPVLNNPA